MNCKYCLEKFDSEEKIIEHQTSSKYCIKYKDISFTCLKCNFNTVGIKNIEKHSLNCNTKIEENQIINTNNLLLRLEKKIDILLNSNNNTKEKESVNIETENEIVLSPKNKKSSNYKTLKNCLELVDEPDDEFKNKKLKEINDFNKNIKSFNIEDSNKIFNDCFEQIKQNRFYTKNLDLIKKIKSEIISKISYSDYINILKNHIKILEKIFTEKEYVEKKIITIISKSLTSLDMRLLFYPNYINTELETEEIEKLKICLSISSVSYYVSFNSKNFYNNFLNYGCVICTIKENIERYLFNIYNFNNVVYIPLKQSSDKDPYSFYILENINKDKRYWKIDYRLEEFSNSFITNIRPYLIDLFRKIYYDVFHDNIFRIDYKSKNSITEFDCEQLIQNIFKLSIPKDFCNFLRNIVKEKATYIPSENDKFNMWGDDIIQKKRFLNKKETTDISDIIKLLFDGITSEEAIDFYRNQFTFSS